MKRDEVLEIEKLFAQTQGLQEEFTSLAKKKSDAPVSAFKLRFVNSTLAELNAVLGDRYRPFSDFEHFDSDDVPTVSDVTMILGQYIECAENMRTNNVQYLNGWWYWILEDDPEGRNRIRTSEPKKIKGR